MNQQRIHDSLNRLFDQHRLIFWYDPEQEWEAVVEGYEREKTQVIKVQDNEFGTKVAIHHDKDPTHRYLLYFPQAKPKDANNWLLDLLLQGHEYKADRSSLIIQEIGLNYEFRPVVEDHIPFFESTRRVQAFKDMLSTEDDISSLRLKMMAILTNTAPEVDAILLSFLDAQSTHPDEDPVEKSFSHAHLIDAFWKEVGLTFAYTNASPSLQDFVTTLFRWANPLESDVTLSQHAQVFLQRWKDSQKYRQAFLSWAKKLEKELHVGTQLNNLDDIRPIEASDTFPGFEMFILHHICQNFESDQHALPDLIEQRRSSFWFENHKHGYEALEQAFVFKSLLATADLTFDSLDTGLQKYTSSWYKIDTAYRRFFYHQRQYGQVNLMAPITDWVEKHYVNNFLLPLTDRWGDHIRTLTTWSAQTQPTQTTFYNTYVQPFVKKNQKIFVIISDALRFEAAAEFVKRLQMENRWTAEIEATLASVPSYTQLGMASLLPGNDLGISFPDASVTLDGHSTKGTPARSQILNTALEGKGVAIQANDFLAMNTKTEARDLMRKHDVIYIYHNVIDKVGDTLSTENKALDAVEDAFEELFDILRKVANTNGSNMLLTADHGFLFQQSSVAATDERPLPSAGEWLYRNRRFAIGHNIEPNDTVKIFTAGEMGLLGDWSAAFPLSLGRYPLQGSGKRYVHGGLSLQEVVIPVVQINKKRSDDTRRVEVEILQSPTKITTGQLSLRLYQDRPVAEKVLPRTLRMGVFASDGTELSEIRTMTFDSADEEPRHREHSIVLTLSRTADEYNNKDVAIRLEEILSGTNQHVTYKTHTVKLQKPFESDFDDI